MMKYFKDCKCKTEAKILHKKLVKQYHPDLNPDVNPDIIKAINAEYDIIIARLPDQAGSASESTTFYTDNFDMDNKTAADFINKITPLSSYDFIDIEIIGCWLWIGGNTYIIKDVLKSLGFMWAANKKMWYWHNPENKSHNRRKMSIDDIRALHGTKTVNKKDLKQNYIA